MKSLKIFFLVVSVILLIGCSNNNSEKQKPTVYLVGDSTVKNGQGDGAGGLWGWGDYIGQFLDTSEIEVENHALGGTSSRTFQRQGLWKPVKDSLKKGDYVLIQFGHNDAGPINDDFRARGTIKGIGDESEEIDNMLTGEHEIVHSYGWYIRKLITDAKEEGAIPIIMSPIPRNNWKNGKVPRNNDSYGGWAKQVAKEENVTFIDLNEKMAMAIEKEGEDQVTGKYFYRRDHTHTSARGALLAASIVVEGIKASENKLRDYMLENPEVELPSKKNVFLIGDSTVANNNDEEAVGWGVPIEQYFDTTRVNVINKARGGRSSRTFRNEGLWDAIKDSIKEGDFVLMQFGHNDGGDVTKLKHRASLKGMSDSIQEVAKPDGSKEEVHTYGWYMKKYISEAKEKGARPIVFSHIPRNKWANGNVERANDSYGKWAREAAEQENALFIDLNDSIAKKYEEIGPEEVSSFFPKDHTHTNMEGAELNAFIIAKNLKQAKETGIRDYIFIKEKKE
ncbi:rhamnogalacturonan acetylesterase [Salegentibacter salinarum]|uniref:Rhamnogalacturonan acetylesterase n=1 Tax=Salegentibacter salinarum TaxID=447422 RepID=A0A2N0TSN8_9FLAO|nr:rhamnogalacturonan acetylesterase [Salegentibacter salinarum]PKD17747.1 rhamnogalacturonan acetylesterase [Salegentibacter salinarum]SKB51406.1 Lysophospholipase L1 [Salegentibacter salinarum]